MKKRNVNITLILGIGFLYLPFVAPSYGGDWPQWGGDNEKNMVSSEINLPENFQPGRKKKGGGGIDQATTQNVRWSARIGSVIYGNPTVADGKVFVGTDAYTLSQDKRFKYRKGGLLKCLDEQTGRLLWQLAIPLRTQLPKGAHFPFQHFGVCSSPAVDRQRVYIVSNADEVICLDINGQADGNQGPFRAEDQFMAGPGHPPLELTPRDADIIWRFDIIDELKVCPHDAVSCSALVYGDFVYVGTSNGVDTPHKKMINPAAPSLIVLDKHTGRLVATDHAQIGDRMYHCQWSSPSVGVVNGRALIFFGGGDGLCYAFQALTEAADHPVHLKKVWSYDCNPPHYKYRDGKLIPYYTGDKRKKNSPNKNDGRYVGPSQIIATPVFHNRRIYVPIGQDPAHGRGKGMLHCIDAARTGDITDSGGIWTYDGMDRTIATVAIADGRVYAMDIAGRVHCLDADTGRCLWTFETKGEAWGGPLVADGKVYFGNNRRFYILAAGNSPRVLSEIRMPDPMYSTPIAANGTVFITSKRDLWALQKN